jgi:RNA polymerase sigma factor (sigma-70 family)
MTFAPSSSWATYGSEKMNPNPAEPAKSGDPSLTATTVLLLRAHSGQADALGQLYARYHDRLSSLARTYLASCPFPVVGAEDAAQDALLSFHGRFLAREFPDLQDSNSLWKLLATITHRKALQAVRSEQTAKRGGGAVGPLQTSSAGRDRRDAEPASMESNPYEAAVEADLLELLYAQLNETNRQIAWLRMAGYTVREIAVRVNRSEKGVERRLDTIREELRKLDVND